jgi:tetratricopeptide (TPR) repeat protein
LVTRHAVPFFRDTTWQREFEFYRNYAAENIRKLYPLFYEFYLLTCVAASRHADCVIDLNEISENDASRQRVTERLDAFGIKISFDDCHLPAYSDLSPEDRECLAYEPTGCEYLIRNLAPGMRIPHYRFESQRGVIGEYFRQILGSFVGYTENRSISSAPPRPRAEKKHGEALRHFEQGRIHQALPLLRDAILEQPSATLWNDWASVQALCKRPVLAELGYRRALERGDRNAPANLGALLFTLCKCEDAIPLVQQALRHEREPENMARLARFLDV